MTRNQPPRSLSLGLALAQQWTLNPMQWDFVACQQRFSFYVGGIGAGKTFAGAVRAIVRAIDHPGALGLVGAPTYAMLRDATLRTFFELLPEPYVAAYNKAEGHLRLRNGSEILFRSLDEPDRLRGLNLAWFWLDEAPLCGYYAWQVLKGRLRQRGYETAGWATGTPHGRDGFARDFELERRRNHALFRASTYGNAHNLPPDYVAELGYTGAFHDQEVLGLFAAFEGLVYAFETGAGGHIREPGGLTTEITEHTETRRNSQGAERDAQDAKKANAIGRVLRAQVTETVKRSNPQGQDAKVVPSQISAPSVISAPVSGSSAFKEWTSVIGGIDWGYTNPTAALVFALDGDGRAWQLDEFYQRRAALEETLLPAVLDLTRRYGVATWYCGPDEPEHIARLAEALAREGLRCRAVKADNAIRPGIQTVTGLLARREDGTRGLYVAPRCVQTIAEYLSYHYDSPAGISPSLSVKGARGVGGEHEARISELPVKQNDHAMDACFVAGTLIETNSGPQPIEDIHSGDLVLTRNGYRRVLSAGMTNPNAEVMQLTFSNGEQLVGTADHPVFVRGVGYIALRTLRPGDEMMATHQVKPELLRCGNLGNPIKVKQLSTKGSSLGSIRGHVAGLIECTTRHPAQSGSEEWAGFTRKSGTMHMEPYRPDIIFIIKTATRSTIRWRNLSAFLARNTTSTIWHFLAQGSVRSAASGLTVSGRKPQTGINQPSGANGTVNVVGCPGRIGRIQLSCASTVAANSVHERLASAWRSSAPMRTNPRTAVPKVRTWKSTVARYAVPRLWQTAFQNPSPAPVHVVSRTGTGKDGKPFNRQAVYNLEVEEAHEYFAQGILVHNCRYALHTALGQRRATSTYLASIRPKRLPPPHPPGQSPG